MRRLGPVALGALVTVLGVADAPPPARACAPAMPEGEQVTVTGEQAVIVWDAARRREHFIRRATFDASAEHFGFLVPTPSAPELSEVDDAVFDSLADQVAPDEVTETDYTFLTCCTSPFLLLAGSGPDAAVQASAVGVEVLSEQRVAGMDATVLAASDADALGAWLGEHGYANRPALVEWLRPYVEARYAITAFRYAKDGPTDEVGSRAVRMSFDADRPFYPYREPSDAPERFGRLLRVYLVSDTRMAPADGWDAQLEHAAPLDAPALIRSLAPDAPAEGRWLTSFLDRARTRAGEGDLFFEPSEDDGEVRPPPIVHHEEAVIPLPIEPLLLIGVGVAIWRWRKRRAATPPAG